MALPSTWHGLEGSNILGVLKQSCNTEECNCDTGGDTDNSDFCDSVSSMINLGQWGIH